MKQISLLSFFLFVTFFSLNVFGQWTQINLPNPSDKIISMYNANTRLFTVLQDANLKISIKFSDDNGITWNTATGLGANLIGSNIAGIYMKNHGKIMNLGGNTLYFFTSYTNLPLTYGKIAVYTSNDNGQSWTLLQETNESFNIGKLIFKNNTLYTSALRQASGYYGMGYSTNGISWTSAGCWGCSGGGGSGAAIALSGSNIVVPTTYGIYYSTDNGQSFIIDYQTPALFDMFEYENKIVGMKPTFLNNEMEIGIYESVNNGITWNLLQHTGLPIIEPYVPILHKSNNNKLFVGCQKGVFLSREGGTNFVPVNEGLPLPINTDNIDLMSSETAIYLKVTNLPNTTSLYYRPLSDFDEIFCSSTGNDANDGKNSNNPKKTIQSAINDSKPDGLVTIISGYFDEEITVPKNIVLQGVNNPIIKNLALKNNSTIAIISPLTLIGLLKIEQGTIFSNGNLILGSNANGTAMVDDNGGKIEGEVKVQRYLGDYSYRTSVRGYTYFSAPTSGSKISDFNDNLPIVLNPAYDFVSAYSGAFPNFFRYNESKVTSASNLFEKGWESPASLTENLEVGRGYILNLNTNTLIDFKGSLNSGNINVPITKGTTNNSGWNLVGNPYPSSLDWEKVWDLNKTKVKPNILRSIAIDAYAGTWAYYTAGVGGLNGGTKDVSLGQGFFLEKINQGNDNLVLNNGMRSYNQTQFFRTEESEESKTQGVVKVKLTSGKWSDETMIYFKREASEQYDESLEVPKSQFNANPAPNLYTSVSGKKVAFNAQSIANLPKETPLHFSVASNGQHQISLSELRNFKENTPIYLEDKKLKTTQDLREKAYSFSANAGTDTSRFVLKFDLAFATEIPDESLAIYPNPATNELKINIDSKYKGNLQIRLTDVLGREVISQIHEKQFTQEEIKVNISKLGKGIYFMEILEGNRMITKKIIKE